MHIVAVSMLIGEEVVFVLLTTLLSACGVAGYEQLRARLQHPFASVVVCPACIGAVYLAILVLRDTDVMALPVALIGGAVVGLVFSPVALVFFAFFRSFRSKHE